MFNHLPYNRFDVPFGKHCRKKGENAGNQYFVAYV